MADPWIGGKKLNQQSISESKHKEWLENVGLMKAFIRDLNKERGTSLWTTSTEFDFTERRFWEECVPQRAFVTPMPGDSEYEIVRRRRNICREEERSTQIPEQCKGVSEPDCGTTVATVGRCRFRRGVCGNFHEYPHWGKVEFENCHTDSNNNYVCDENIYQWCRRVFPQSKALAYARGHQKLDGLHFRRWLVLMLRFRSATKSSSSSSLHDRWSVDEGSVVNRSSKEGQEEPRCSCVHPSRASSKSATNRGELQST